MFNNLKRKIMFCLDKVILGFIPRIHAKQLLCRHYRACPDNLDPRDGLFVTPEDDNLVAQCGRSMIEMLGVLAIVGVLSVGGIQGYSKAMDMYHWNKALGQWRLIINLMNIYEPQLHINNSSDVGELSLIPILRATGDLPEEMLVNEDYTVVDALGSSLYIYAHNTGYVGIASFNQKDNYTACRLFFTIGQYYHDMIDVIQIYTNDPNKDPSNGNKQFIGDKYCGASSKNCLKDLGVAQITDLCKNNKVCNGMTSCHYLMHWLSH